MARLVWPGGDKVPAASLNSKNCIKERGEPVLVETLVAELSVEALDVRVLLRLAGLDELQREPRLAAARVERAAPGLRAIVGWQGRRLPARRCDGEAPAGAAVDPDEAPEPSAIAERVAGKIYAPRVGRAARRRPGHPGDGQPNALPRRTASQSS